jgi:proteasome lid subunit RPN8/RPN11
MTKAKVFLSIQAYQKMRLWVELAKGEVAWLGTVSEMKDTRGSLEAFLIEDIHLLKQVCTGANTVLDDVAVAGFLTEMAKKGEDTSKIKAWIHSHGELKCFWSGTDEDCISDLANSSYLISIVTNKDGNILARVDIFKPFQVTVNDVKVDIYYPEDGDLLEFCKKEFKEKVTESAFFIGGPIHQSFPGTSDIDQKIEELEEKVSTGKMSLAEYQHEIAKLEMDYEPFWD